MKVSFALCLVLLIAQATCEEQKVYDLALPPAGIPNALFISKDAAVRKYSGNVTVTARPSQFDDTDDTDTTTCDFRFCASRSFLGTVNEIDSDGNRTVRLLTDEEGCLTLFNASIDVSEEDTKVAIPEFEWNAAGEFYLNGIIESGECTVLLNIGGLECERKTYSDGGACLPASDYSPTDDTVQVVAGEGGFTFAVESPTDSNRLGQLTMILNVDPDSVGLDNDDNLGSVRLLLNGVPSENDLDFEVPLVAPQTELSIAAMRSFSTYFYSVVANPEVIEVGVSVENLTPITCTGETYGPNCSISAKVLGYNDMDKVLTFDSNSDSNCMDNVCFFTLVQKNVNVSVSAKSGIELESYYKANNFPTENDYDVQFAGNATYCPDALNTEPIAHFAVSVDAPSGEATFNLVYGQVAPPPPPPPPSDDDLPWAWIGVAIALGAISLALIVGFAIYTFTNKPQPYELVDS